MFILSDEEVVKLQNRMNDLWECDTRLRNHGDYVATANRLIGTLYTLLTPDHYRKNEGKNA